MCRGERLETGKQSGSHCNGTGMNEEGLLQRGRGENAGIGGTVL